MGKAAVGPDMRVRVVSCLSCPTLHMARVYSSDGHMGDITPFTWPGFTHQMDTWGTCMHVYSPRLITWNKWGKRMLSIYLIVKHILHFFLLEGLFQWICCTNSKTHLSYSNISEYSDNIWGICYVIMYTEKTL